MSEVPRPRPDTLTAAAPDGLAPPARLPVVTDPVTMQLQLASAIRVGRIAQWRHDLLLDRVSFNDVAESLLGRRCPPGGLSAEAFRQLIHPDDRRVLDASAQAAREQAAPVEVELRVRAPDGTTPPWRSLRSGCVVERDAAGRPVALHGVSVDVTEPRRDARRAQHMVRRLEAIGQAAGMGFWSLRRRPGHTYWGQHLYRMHGLEPRTPVPLWNDWLGRHVHAEDRERVRASVGDWLRSRRAVHVIEFRLLAADGVERHVIAHSRMEDEDGLRRPYGLLIDVTEQRVAQDALRRQGERVRLVTAAVQVGTWEHDLRAGQVYWDEQMWLLRGRPPRDEPPTSEERRAILHPEDAVRLYDGEHFGAYRNRSEAQAYEFRVCWPDGSWHWLASRSITEADAQGRPVRRFGLNWDVTAEREARAAQDEKLAAQRELQAKLQFLSRMSHELRTPLNAVLGFTQLLMADDARLDAGARRARLEQIRHAGQHLLALIDDVLDLSRLEGGEMPLVSQSVAMAPLVEATLPLVEPLAREHGVTIEVGPLAGQALGDATRLRQVLLNLLTNAIKYNRRGGHVRIEAGNAESVCLLRVIDDGRGMTREQLQHLFEPFNRLGAEQDGVPGTGIGLAIVKALVERMNGTVHVESTPGAGSRFELRLRDGHAAPLLAETQVSPEMLALAAASSGTPRHGRILYVEDNPVNAMILGELVAQRAGLTLQTAETGGEGIERATRWRPDLVLLDMQLPDMSGEQVFARLREQPETAGIPCIALSANAMPADIERALRAGFADYWTKPLDFRLFHTAVETLFGPAPAHA